MEWWPYQLFQESRCCQGLWQYRLMSDDLFAPIGRQSATDAVVENIQSLIVDQRLAPGAALPAERELAAMLGVSRNVLREALGVLGHRGLISSRPGSGNFVARPTGKVARDAIQLLLDSGGFDLVQLCEARIVIEPELAALAALKADEHDKECLNGRMQALADSANSASQHAEADVAFHEELARIAEQPVLRAIVETLWDPVSRGMAAGAEVVRAVSDSDAQHRRILASVVNGEPEAARQAMTDHLRFVLGQLQLLNTE